MHNCKRSKCKLTTKLSKIITPQIHDIAINHGYMYTLMINQSLLTSLSVDVEVTTLIGIELTPLISDTY